MKLRDFSYEQFVHTNSHNQAQRNLEQAWYELHKVPSYVERYQHAVSDDQLAARLEELDKICPNLEEYPVGEAPLNWEKQAEYESERFMERTPRLQEDMERMAEVESDRYWENDGSFGTAKWT